MHAYRKLPLFWPWSGLGPKCWLLCQKREELLVFFWFFVYLGQWLCSFLSMLGEEEVPRPLRHRCLSLSPRNLTSASALVACLVGYPQKLRSTCFRKTAFLTTRGSPSEGRDISWYCGQPEVWESVPLFSFLNDCLRLLSLGRRLRYLCCWYCVVFFFFHFALFRGPASYGHCCALKRRRQCLIQCLNGSHSYHCRNSFCSSSSLCF